MLPRLPRPSIVCLVRSAFGKTGERMVWGWLMKVLVAEDDAVSRRVLEARLAKWGYDVTTVEDGQRAAEVLAEEDAPRLAILDWMMPGMDGVEVLRGVRGADNQVYTYVILLTAKDSREDIVAGLGEGADDYIVKPFNTHELEVRVRAGKRIVELQAELMGARDALSYQATHDSLTGLYNRGEGTAVLERELERMRREKSSLAVAMVDLDHFKHVNDTYGHAAGDSVLRRAAERMQSSVRPYDSVCRYGGEEFFIVLPNNTRDQAVALAERIRLRVREAPAATEAGEVFVTASLGVAIGGADDTVDVDGLLAAADAALYRAKQCGRDQVQIACEGDYRRVVGT